MTELLSREKEFLKLNEQLDKLATTALEQTQHCATSPTDGGGGIVSPSNAPSLIPQAKGDPRFFTYTKNKGQSTLLKKRGAGDSVLDEITVAERSTTNSVRVMRQSKINTPSSAAPTTSPSQRIDEEWTTPPPTEGFRKDANTVSNTANTTAPSTYRKNIKSTDSTRTYSRTSQRSNATNTSTFLVRYRNPKFVESPSLEVLVKDEGASLRPKPQVCSAPSDVESVTSTATTIMIAGGSTTRRSHANSTTTKKNITADGLIKFLKSKIAILEEDHDRISQEMTQQKELLERTLERHKNVEQQRDQAYAKHNALTEQLSKVETQLEEANRRIKERVIEQSSQQKELETVKREVKVLTQTNSNLEKRLYRANEELENAKSALTLMKNAEREMKEATRVDNESKEKQIKSLKKQRADLLNAYKKQLFLIDNLKRQNICMEQSKMIGFGEKEFSKVLEWNMKT